MATSKNFSNQLDALQIKTTYFVLDSSLNLSYRAADSDKLPFIFDNKNRRVLNYFLRFVTDLLVFYSRLPNLLTK